MHSSDLPESANISSKVDDLATQSGKLEKDLAETMAYIKNVNTSADKPANTDKEAKVSQVATSSRVSTSFIDSSNDHSSNVRY